MQRKRLARQSLTRFCPGRNVTARPTQEHVSWHHGIIRAAVVAMLVHVEAAAWQRGEKTRSLTLRACVFPTAARSRKRLLDVSSSDATLAGWSEQPAIHLNRVTNTGRRSLLRSTLAACWLPPSTTWPTGLSTAGRPIHHGHGLTPSSGALPNSNFHASADHICVPARTTQPSTLAVSLLQRRGTHGSSNSPL